MKTLVAYMSKTGNTKKVAEAMFEEIEGEKEIKPIDEVETLEGYDIAFLGFPVLGSGPDKKTVKFLEKHCIDGRNVVLFITHASPEDAYDLPLALDKFRHAACGANIVDLFDCQGELAKAIKLVMSVWPNAQYRMWAKNDNSQGQPDKTRLDLARAFARDVMQKISDSRKVQEKVLAEVAY